MSDGRESRSEATLGAGVVDGRAAGGALAFGKDDDVACVLPSNPIDDTAECVDVAEGALPAAGRATAAFPFGRLGSRNAGEVELQAWSDAHD